MSTKEKKDHDLPEEWIELVKEAMKSDITKEQFRYPSKVLVSKGEFSKKEKMKSD